MATTRFAGFTVNKSSRTDKVLLRVEDVRKYFALEGGRLLHAVDDVSLQVGTGKTFGLVGESGCGKTTLGRVVAGLLQATSGRIWFEDIDLARITPARMRKMRRHLQMMFQDPYSSLNPRKSIRQIVSEPLIINKLAKGKSLDDQVCRALDRVGLSRKLLNKYPHELDGGKRQCVGIARAMVLDPLLVVCDEPVSSLDVSNQAKILNLLIDIQRDLHVSYILISHDLAVVRYVSHRVAVMYLGQIVEEADTEELFQNPLHPYTKALLSAVPRSNAIHRLQRIVLEGDVPSPVDPGPGCRFQPRCWLAQDKCGQIAPQIEERGSRHLVACHR